MQNLINLIFLIVGAIIFYSGYKEGIKLSKEPEQKQGSFFIPPIPKVKDIPTKQPKQQKQEDNTNKFYK